jgi:hypothetical protein
LDDLGLRALDELPALGASEITEALQSLVLEGQNLTAPQQSGDLLDETNQEMALEPEIILPPESSLSSDELTQTSNSSSESL